MGNGNHKKDEIVVCNTLFKYDLIEVNENTFDLIATPCCNPTAVYNIARITMRQNGCNEVKFYQAFINTDPVEIIQDCNLEGIIRRSIVRYFDNLPVIDCSRECGCCGGNRNNNWLF